MVRGVQRPAEIATYKTIGLTPALLVTGLVIGAIVALTLTLVASVHQRRRDLALLKTIGFVRRQVAAAVACQATTAAIVGIVIGIPLGLVVGRWLWDLFAEQINAVPYPTVPVPAIVPVAVGTVLLANLVAVLPARSAARTLTAPLLRDEQQSSDPVSRGQGVLQRRDGYFLGAIASLRSSSAAFSSAERFRRAESAEANCSPVGVFPPERKR